MEKLSVCLIVKNEEPVLGRCLACAAQFADELIVVDTGSTDRSVEIAREYTPLVYLHPWQNSFAEARNYSYSKATGDYVMWLDADDVITQENIARFQTLKTEAGDADLIFTIYRNYTESGLADYILRDRIIRRAVFKEWLFDIHEAMRMEPEWKRLFRTDIEILHKKEHVNEPERNMDIFNGLLEAGKPLDPFEKSNLVKEYSLHHMTDEALALYRELDKAPPSSRPEYAFSFLMLELCRAKRWQDGYDAITEAETKLPLTARMLYFKGRCAEELGDEVQAEALYRRALTVKNDPLQLNICYTGYDDYYPYLRLAVLADRKGDRQEALRLLDCAGEHYPKDKTWQNMRLCMALNIETVQKEKKEDKVMAKTQQELKELKEEMDRLSERLKALSDDELAQIVGGGSELSNSTNPSLEPLTCRLKDSCPGVDYCQCPALKRTSHCRF